METIFRELHLTVTIGTDKLMARYELYEILQ